MYLIGQQTAKIWPEFRLAQQTAITLALVIELRILIMKL